MNLGLQKKAVFIVGIILLCILAVNTGVLTLVAAGKFRSAILSRSDAFVEGLHKDLEKVISLGVPVESLEGVDEKLKDLKNSDSAIGYAMITDMKGKVLFHTDQTNAGKQLSDETSRIALSSGKKMIQSAGAHYDLSFPLLGPDGKPVGALRAGVNRQAINSQMHELLIWALAISVVCFFLSLGLINFFITKFITRPIIKMEKAADKIASGDLTYIVSVEGNDEVASLGNAINRMSLNLKDMLSKIAGITQSVNVVTSNIAGLSTIVLSAADVQKKAVAETASAVEEIDKSIAQASVSAGNLAENAVESSSAIFEMSASIENIAENANIFSQSAHDTASSVEQMVSTIKQIASSLDNLTASSSEIASSIEEVNATTKDIEYRASESVGLAETVTTNASSKGLESATAAMTGMENIKNSVVALSDVINMLGKRTNDIGKILNVIDDVADQTNLLALNAAILASKAGEHGKGFSIVADEIKNLAERTSVSTGEIASMIKSVQDVMKSSIRMASDGIHAVEKGLVLVRAVDTALRDILDSSRASTEMAKAIQRATSEESIVIKQITDAIEGMTSQTETISRAIQEQNKGSMLIIDSTDKVKDLSRQVMTSTGEQRDGSKQISHVIENVTEQASQIVNATGRQREMSLEIVRSMEKIKETTGRLIISSNDMNAVIASLKADAVNLQSELQKFKV